VKCKALRLFIYCPEEAHSRCKICGGNVSYHPLNHTGIGLITGKLEKVFIERIIKVPHYNDMGFKSYKEKTIKYFVIKKVKDDKRQTDKVSELGT
jgi:hypothetical protein